MSSTIDFSKKALSLIFAIWLFGAFITFGYELINRKIQCIKSNGFLSGLMWCEFEPHEVADPTRISIFIAANSNYFHLVYKSVTWPIRILNISEQKNTEDFVISKGNQKQDTHQCIQKYGPKMKQNVRLTMDDAVLLIPVQLMCTLSYKIDHPPSKKPAKCVLEKLYLGLRSKEYVNLVDDCLSGYKSTEVSNFFGVSVCMMVMMEDGKITDQQSTVLASEYCTNQTRKAHQMLKQSR